MLLRAEEIRGYHLQATDGEIGKVKDFYFDDVTWTVRHLVADTGKWLASRKVLISPHSIQAFNKDKRLVDVNLTREQIEKSPPIEEDQPVSVQREMEYFKYFGWPWYGADIVGAPLYPVGLPSIPPVIDTPNIRETGDPHLRSAHEVAGYVVHTLDGEIGRVEDFLVEESSWIIRYLLVDARKFSERKHVLISRRWIERVSWRERRAFINLSADAIERSPDFDASTPVTRDYEEALHRHYGQTAYWI